MRKPFNNHHGLTGNAIAGIHVVFFGLDLALSARPCFRGFAFQRADHTEGDTVWLRGTKTFEKTKPHPASGETFSTRQHPVQSFQWADYSAKPNHAYTYKILALYGDPAHLDPKHEAKVEVKTEVETGLVHSAFFNRGSVATQEYAHRFQNKPPNVVGPAAYDWLSRGLLEALVAFLDRAGPGCSIHGAVYEFQWPSALAAIKKVHQGGAEVKILFDDIQSYDSKGKPAGAWKKNREAIAMAGIKPLQRDHKRQDHAQQVLHLESERRAEGSLDRFHQPHRERDLRPFQRWAYRRGPRDRTGIHGLLAAPGSGSQD
ncbi:MAG: hypothetical protein ABSA10_03490 [Anaerolineales bacterium]|jgi:hypothetical protein